MKDALENGVKRSNEDLSHTSTVLNSPLSEVGPGPGGSMQKHLYSCSIYSVEREVAMWKANRYVSDVQQSSRAMDDALIRSITQLEKKYNNIGNFRTRFPNSLFYESANVYIMSLCSSSIWHFMQASWRAPNGARVRTGLTNSVLRAPSTATNFALWSAVHTVMKRTIERTTHREGRLTNFASSGLVGYMSSMRNGTGKAAKNAATGMAFLLVMEKVGGVVGKGVMAYSGLKARGRYVRSEVGERWGEWQKAVQDGQEQAPRSGPTMGLVGGRTGGLFV